MEYYNLQKTAEVLNVTTGDVNRLREQGKLHGYRDGNDWKFKDDEVKKFLADSIKGRTNVNIGDDEYHENMAFEMDDDTPSLDEGTFSSLLDKTVDKISSPVSAPSTKSQSNNILDDSFLSNGSDLSLDLSGDSGLSLVGTNDIQLGGGSRSDDNQLSTSNDSGLSLLDNEFDFSKDELNLTDTESKPQSNGGALDLLNNSGIGDEDMTIQAGAGAYDAGEDYPVTSGTSKPDDLLAFGNEDDDAVTIQAGGGSYEIQEDYSPASSLPQSQFAGNDFLASGDEDDDAVTIQAGGGSYEIQEDYSPASSLPQSQFAGNDFLASGDEDDDAVTIQAGGESYDLADDVSSHSSSAQSQFAQSDVLSFDSEGGEDDAATILVDRTASQEPETESSMPDTFGLAPEGTSANASTPVTSGQASGKPVEQAEEIFGLAGDDDDEMPTIMSSSPASTSSASTEDDDDGIFGLAEDALVKSGSSDGSAALLAGNSNDDIALAPDKTSSSSDDDIFNFATASSSGAQSAAADSPNVEDNDTFDLEPSPEHQEESDSDSASQVIPLESDDFFTKDDNSPEVVPSPLGGDMPASPFGQEESDPFGGIGMLPQDNTTNNPDFTPLDGGDSPFGLDTGDVGGTAPGPDFSGMNVAVTPDLSSSTASTSGCSYAAGKCPREGSYSTSDTLLLLMAFVLLLPASIVAYELIRYIWSWGEPFTLSGSIIETLGGLFKL